MLKVVRNTSIGLSSLFISFKKRLTKFLVASKISLNDYRKYFEFIRESVKRFILSTKICPHFNTII